MSRPSKHTDQLLIRTARKIYPRTGYAHLNLREVADAAGVNLGMFHYHFKTKDEFVRRVLQEFYEEFFRGFDLENNKGATPLAKLRSVLLGLAKFNRDNKDFMAALFRDLMNGEKVVLEFGKANLSRHGSVIYKLILDCQKAGLIERCSPSQIMGFAMAGINFPILITSFVGAIPNIPKKVVAEHQKSILTDHALSQRVDMVLKGISVQKRRAG